MMMTIIIVIIISQEHTEETFNVKAIAYYHIFSFRFACEYFPFSSIGNRQSTKPGDPIRFFFFQFQGLNAMIHYPEWSKLRCMYTVHIWKIMCPYGIHFNLMICSFFLLIFIFFFPIYFIYLSFK